MPTNSYFSSNYTAEAKDQALVQDLIIESIKIYGIDVEYVPRTYVNLDDLYGEDASSAFNNSYTVELYIKNVEGWGGEREFLSKFGIEIRDEITLTVARKRFTDIVTAGDSSITRPREGDLIHLPKEVDHRQRLFEITFIEDEDIHYQLGSLFVYDMRCKVFEYGGETFDTGVTEIDDMETYANTSLIILDSGVGDYQVGETVTQTAGYEGEVVSWDSGNKELVLTKTKGTIDTDQNIVGQTSAASWSVNELESETNSDVGNQSDNEFIEGQETDVIDFSETNPFSE